MDRAVAERLMKVLLDLSGDFNEAMALTDQIADEQERKSIRRHLAEMLSPLYDTMIPIIRLYPDLDPDKDEPWYREMMARRPPTQ